MDPEAGSRIYLEGPVLSNDKGVPTSVEQLG